LKAFKGTNIAIILEIPKLSLYLCTSSLAYLSRKAEGIWPDEALATHTVYSIV
jgi:hypothetical protein